MKEGTITIVMPARDEVANLESAVNAVLTSVPKWFADFELIIINDGSRDGTGAVADRLAALHLPVRVIHNRVPANLGGAVRQGLEQARMDWFMYVDGKGATSSECLDRIFSCRGRADLVVPYPENSQERPWGRRMMSMLFQWTLNRLFGLHLKYFNHVVLYPTTLARRVRPRTRSYAFQAEWLVKLIKSGATYVEVGVQDRFDMDARRSKALRPANVAGVLWAILSLVWDVRVRKPE